MVVTLNALDKNGKVRQEIVGFLYGTKFERSKSFALNPCPLKSGKNKYILIFTVDVIYKNRYIETYMGKYFYMFSKDVKSTPRNPYFKQSCKEHNDSLIEDYMKRQDPWWRPTVQTMIPPPSLPPNFPPMFNPTLAMVPVSNPPPQAMINPLPQPMVPTVNAPQSEPLWRCREQMINESRSNHPPNPPFIPPVPQSSQIPNVVGNGVIREAFHSKIRQTKITTANFISPTDFATLNPVPQFSQLMLIQPPQYVVNGIKCIAKNKKKR